MTGTGTGTGTTQAENGKRETGNDTEGRAPVRLSFAFRAYPSAVLDVEGPDRVAFLQGQLASDVRLAEIGRAIPAVGLTPKGKILYAGRLVGGSDRLRLLIPAGNDERERVLVHLRKYAAFQKVSIVDRTAEIARVAFFGPTPGGNAGEIVPPDGSGGVDVLEDTAGEIHSEWLVPASRLSSLLAGLEASGGVLLSEEEADVRRIEAGRAEWGIDADESNLPDEAGLADAVSITKGCYVGQEIVARLRTYGRTNRRLVGYRFPEGLLPRGSVLRRPDDHAPETSRVELGRITSAAVSPRLGPIGLGYAFRDIAAGDRLVSTIDPSRSAVVSTLPFS